METVQSLAVWSPKGGVGKSVLSVALALRLAERRRTLLVDGNPDNPDIASLLQCPRTPNVTGWVEAGESADLEQRCVRYSANLWVLPGPMRYSEADSFDGPVMETVLQAAREEQITVVIDLGTSLRNSTVVALDQVDQVLVPVTLDLLSLAPLKRLARELELWQLPKSKFSVLINRQTGTREITVEDVQDFSEFPVVGVVPSSRELAEAVNQGQLAAALTRGSPVATAVEKLLSNSGSGEARAPGVRKGLLSGLLSGFRKGGQA